MSLQNKISIDISAINPLTKEYNYATITLPATPMEIEDAFQKARVTKDGEYFVEIISSPKVPKLGEVYIDGEKNIVELNLLAKKLSLLDDNQLTVFNALFENSIDDDMMAPSLEELINMTDGLGKVIPVHGITTDEQLGEFVIDNNLSEVLQTASDDVLEYVSTKIVGQKFREMEKGVFYNGAYIPLGAYEKQYGYKSPSKEQLEVKNHYAFALNIAEAPVNDSEETADSAEWIYLPADKEYINGIARIHNEGCIEDCVFYEFKSVFKCIDSQVFGDMQDFDKLNEIAQRYVRLDDANRIKFKAVVETVEPQTLDEVLEISDNLNRYEHSYYSVSEGDFAMEYLARQLPTNFDMNAFDKREVRNFGERIIMGMEAKVRDYGIVSAKDQSLYETITATKNEQEEEYQDEIETQDEGYGGMTM